MTKILHLDSSAKGETSVTRKLTAEAVAKLKTQSDVTVVYRDLTANPLPHISPEYLGGIFGNADFASHETVLLSDKLIGELMDAETIVIGAPMYNFSIPSQLKAWVDFVLRAGKTFKYIDGAPVGLVTGKRAIIAVGSGGVYSQGPMAEYDHVAPFMKQVLGFIGITDVTVVRAEKQALGPDAAAEGFKEGEAELERAIAA